MLQVIDNDDPGPVIVDGNLENAGVYTQPTGEPARDPAFDVTVAHPSSDSACRFTDIELRGDFYNGMRGDLNMVLEFSGGVEGVISATSAVHDVDEIDASNWWELGKVVNTPQAPINNGVIVSLANCSRWSVTGTSYLTSLTLDAASSVTAAEPGRSVTLTVDGTHTVLRPGAFYRGALVLTVS